MHTQQNLFLQATRMRQKKYFSVCTSDLLHLVKIALNLVFSLCPLNFLYLARKKTGCYKKPEEKNMKYLFNLKSSINPLLFCLQLNREFVLIILIAKRARAINRLKIKSTYSRNQSFKIFVPDSINKFNVKVF